MVDPEPTFSYLVTQLRSLYPKFAYLHVVEPRVAAGYDREAPVNESNDFIRAIWNTPESESNNSMYIAAGRFSLEDAKETSQKTGQLVAFGRYYIPNVRCF